jgi:hypothetical protein
MFNKNDDPNRVNPPEESIIDQVRDTEHYQNALHEEIQNKKEMLRKAKSFRVQLTENILDDMDDELGSKLVDLAFDSLNPQLAQKVAMDVRVRCEKLIDQKAEELAEITVNDKYEWGQDNV